MNEKAASAQQKASEERKRGQHARAIKRLEQAILAFPDEIDLHLDAVDACLEGGEVAQATRFLKTVQDRFPRDRDRVAAFVRDKLAGVHDPAFARFVVENAIKLRDLVTALDHLTHIPDHAVRDLLTRTRTKKQSLKSASHSGHSLRGEMLTNEIMSALLSLRVGNLKEAVTAIVQILDEKPVDHEILLPFLSSLVDSNSKSGRVRFAYACAQCASGSEMEAIGQFVEAARLEQPVATLCADRLRVLRETTKAGEKVTRALAETLLIKGDMEEASEVLRDHLQNVKDAGREVILMVRPFIDPANGTNACTWVALDAAMTLDRSNAALEILRPLHQRGNCCGEIYAWFERQPKDHDFTPEMMLMHAALALDERQYERAAEIMRGVCESSPPDVPAVLGMLDRCREAHPALEALHGEYASRDEVNEPAGTGDGAGDFQMFDNREFSLPGAAPITPAGTGDTGTKAVGFAEQMKKKIKKGSFIETREISFDDDGGDGSAEPEVIEHPGDEIPAQAIDAPPAKESLRAEVTEAHVLNVAGRLGEAGAAAFFHVEGGIEGPEAAVSASAAPETAPAPGVPPKPSFDESFEEFKNGRLDNTRTIALMEKAVAEGRADELQALLSFEPENDGERFSRRYFQAEYLILRNRPLPAVEILFELDVPELTGQQKQLVWFKIAACQRLVRDFGAANETLTRMVKAFPDREEYARLARTNYEQYLSDQSRDAAVLEKTSSLH